MLIKCQTIQSVLLERTKQVYLTSDEYRSACCCQPDVAVVRMSSGNVRVPH